MSDVLTEVKGHAGLITLNRPKALNALTLGMIRELTQTLLAWRDDERVEVVAIRGQGKEGPFGAFCAGGDIRFFHQAALAGNPELEDFFTEEYALNHLIHCFPKPYVVFMDGIVMGGGMGIAGHGSPTAIRIGTERSKIAMPETNIGLFPDVGGGWFLARCTEHVGEYLGLTGEVIGTQDAIAVGLADLELPSVEQASLWDDLAERGLAVVGKLRTRAAAQSRAFAKLDGQRVARAFAHKDVPSIFRALEEDGSEWAAHTLATLRKRSPLMLYVVLEQLKRARGMSLAEDLRMERDMVRRCFHLRPGAASETVEGIRALAVDKDQQPRWNPARIEEVTPEMVAAFFDSPWPAHAHPLKDLT